MLGRKMRRSLREVVILVALLNLAYFGVEFTIARRIGSVSLFADSVDFLEDASLNTLIAVALGWVYTAISEHVNTVRGAWRYSDLMPIVPGVNVGLSPLLQWLVVPCIGLWWAARRNVSP